MKRGSIAIFFCSALITGPALADPCVKVRQGDAYACMKFSSSEKRAAASHGLQLAAPFAANKRALLKRGWNLGKQWLSENGAGAADGKEMRCGSGLDAVCQTAFRKNERVLVLTLSAVNEGKPLIAAEEIKQDSGAAGFARTLTTPSFVVQIKLNCAEGNVTCDDVTYVGTSKKTGKSIRLRGKTKHSLCADQVTPCRFLAYEFWNGRTSYQVFDDGRLSVRQQEKTLLEEQGRWK